MTAEISPLIYIASKTKYANQWRKLRDEEGYRIISTWIDEAGPGETLNKAELAERCLEEAAAADMVILYCESNDVAKGSLIEVGAALAMGVPIFQIGTCVNDAGGSVFGDHFLWYVAPSIKTAVEMARTAGFF